MQTIYQGNNKIKSLHKKKENKAIVSLFQEESDLKMKYKSSLHH
jgi:hypothetical protein